MLLQATVRKLGRSRYWTVWLFASAAANNPDRSDVRDSRGLSGGNGWLHSRPLDRVSAYHVENSDVCSVPEFPES